MRFKLIFIVCLTLIPLFFSMPVYANDSDQIGLAISGPLVNARFVVVRGQVIVSYLSIQNTGQVALNISFSEIYAQGPLDNSISATLPSAMHALTPQSTTRANITFRVNTTEPTIILIVVEAIGSDEGNIVSAGAVAKVTFLSGGPAYNLTIRCRDQYGTPFRGLDLELSRNLTKYATARSDAQGLARFLLGNGTYRIRVYQDGSLMKTLNLYIIEDRDIDVLVQRAIPTRPAVDTIHLLELCVGLLLGYLIRCLEKGKIRRRLRQLREHHPYEPTHRDSYTIT